MIPLCTVSELEDPGSKGITITRDDMTQNVFVVRKSQKVYAYLNQCPHTGSPLDWTPDQFLDIDKTFIMCATHGATFRIEDGLCVDGPCVNQRLTKLRTVTEHNTVYLIEQTQDKLKIRLKEHDS